MTLRNLFTSYDMDMVLITPSYRCNLKCDGCFEEGWDKPEMTADEFNTVLKKLDRVRNIIFMGGELLCDKSKYYHRILKQAETHPRQNIVLISNGTFFTDQVVNDIILRSIIPFISIDGLQNLHDQRRGIGVFNLVVNAMERLMMKRALYGIATTVTSYNINEVLTIEYVNFIINYGASFLIFFPFLMVEPSPTNKSNSLQIEQIDSIVRFVDRINKKGMCIRLFYSVSFECKKRGCPAGSRLLHIDSDCTVKCCPLMSEGDFNILTGELDDRKTSQYYTKMYELTKNNKTPCIVQSAQYLNNKEI